MNKFMIRFILFSGAAALTAGMILLLKEEPSTGDWIGCGFLILAEALAVLSPAAAGEYDFPLRLPLLLFVFPCYVVLTLVLLLCAGYFQWKKLLAIELIAVFPVFASVCIAALAAGKSKEN